MVRSTQTAGSPAGTCVIRIGIGGQKLILGGLVCPTGQGTSGLDTLRGRSLLLGSGRLTLCRLGAFIGTACFTFRICREIEPAVSHVPSCKECHGCPDMEPHTPLRVPLSTLCFLMSPVPSHPRAILCASWYFNTFERWVIPPPTPSPLPCTFKMASIVCLSPLLPPAPVPWSSS